MDALKSVARLFINPSERDTSEEKERLARIRLCWLGLTENGSRLIDGGRALNFCVPPPSSAEAAEEVSARGLRPTPYPKVAGPVFLPPYVKSKSIPGALRKTKGKVSARRLRGGGFVLWDFVSDRDGAQTMVEIETGSVSIILEDLLFSDFSPELRDFICNPNSGQVKLMADAAAASRATRTLGEWFVAQVQIGGQCVFECTEKETSSFLTMKKGHDHQHTDQADRASCSRKIQLKTDDDHEIGLLQQLVRNLLNSEPEDEIDGRWHMTDGRLVTRVATRPPLPQKRNSFLETALLTFADTEPRVLAIQEKQLTITLLRQAYASLLRLLTIRDARRKWADNLKAALHRAVEDAKWSKAFCSSPRAISDENDSEMNDLAGTHLPFRFRHRVIGDDRRISASGDNLCASLLLTEDHVDLDDLLGNINFNEKTRSTIQASISFLDTLIASKEAVVPPPFTFDECPFHFTLHPVDRWCPEDDYDFVLSSRSPLDSNSKPTSTTAAQSSSFVYYNNSRPASAQAEFALSPSEAVATRMQ